MYHTNARMFVYMTASDMSFRQIFDRHQSLTIVCIHALPGLTQEQIRAKKLQAIAEFDQGTSELGRSRVSFPFLFIYIMSVCMLVSVNVGVFGCSCMRVILKVRGYTAYNINL